MTNTPGPTGMSGLSGLAGVTGARAGAVAADGVDGSSDRQEEDSPGLEMWGGVECTVNRVGDRWFNQLEWSGHSRRPEDVDAIAGLGIRAVRYPVLWERVAPVGLTQLDWTWTDSRLGQLRDAGLRPIAGLLHHGSGPAYTSLLDPGFPEKLAAYAGAVAERYPWIEDFTPVNEPLTTARFSGLYGHWYPHGRSDRDFVRALLNQVRGVVLAMRAIRAVTPAARLVQTEDFSCTFGTPALRSQVAYERCRRWLTWDLLCGRVDRRHPLYRYLTEAGMTADDEAFFREAPCPPDILGLNYYLTSDRYLDHRLDRYPPAAHGGNGFVRYADVEAVRARPRGIVGHEESLIAAWNRYRLPVALTEVHLGCSRDEQLRWLHESWQGATRARSRGADVRAVTAWALFGSFNWDSLVTCDRGSYEPGAFDVRGARPRPTALAALVRTLANGDRPRHPAFDGPPWWRRPERLVHQGGRKRHPRRRPPTASAPDRPLLIVGATGTLGSAFARVAQSRGLATRVLTRADLDIGNPARATAVIREVQPWAVVNAAGYVRVDDAEGDPEACRLANVIGPVNLALACRRDDLPLVTFSSDLVFDGSVGRAYVETDSPAPLNVYGATKAEAETRVLEAWDRSLVVRTSAFFGPWDQHNFLSMVFRALDSGEPVVAPRDSTVSPTYVPDLVQTTLDLLIDGERGLWHLANRGAVTWFEFARAAAQRSGRDPSAIAGGTTDQMWRPALRPKFSVLASDRGCLMKPLDDVLDDFVGTISRPQPEAASPR